MDDEQRTEETRPCDFCEDGIARVEQKTQRFLYGVEEPVELHAVVPVWTCDRCGHAYTDGEAEEIRDAAVRAYLAAKGAR
jgi:rubrerythrin